MLTINKKLSHSAIDFAAEELKKYLRMMMPEGGGIEIKYAPEAKDGFRLGLMQDLGLDTSDAEDPELDDILYIDCSEIGGVIAGSNPRSVLLSVYEYLRQNGCRWLFPGVDGEYIPMKDIEPVRYRHKPSCRFRGQCNEGAEIQSDMLAAIDFTPKVGMNVFMMEFNIPSVYYNWYYNHPFNEENRPPEPLSDRQVLQYKRQCESEIAKRGLQFHDMGHGFAVHPFGISSSLRFAEDDSAAVPEQTRQYLAMIDGKRGLFKKKPLNTNFCMSNPEARKRVVDYVCGYAESHSNVDYLHVWLADANKNHCECDNCRRMIPSDWYMVLMNEIDDALSAKNLDTRIVFIVYTDTTWPPVTERIKNPKRFSILFAPISRSYLMTLPEGGVKTKPWAFELNKMTLPRTLEEYLAFFAEWRKFWHGSAFAYEYHFWWHTPCDVTGITMAKRISEDIKVFKQHGVNGVVEDGSQRAFFPNGLAFYTYARTLYDISLTPEELAEDYYKAAYGEDWKKFYEYISKLADIFDVRYLEGRLSSDSSKSAFYNPEYAMVFDRLDTVLAEGKALIEKNYNSDYRARTFSVRLLEYHQQLLRGLAEVIKARAVGDDVTAGAKYTELRISFGRHEAELEKCFDHFLYFDRYDHIANRID